DINNGILTNIKIPKDRTIINKFVGENITAEEIYDYLMNDPEVKREKNTKIIKISDGSPGKGRSGEENVDSSGMELEVTEMKITMPDGQEIHHSVDVILNKKTNKDKMNEEQGNITSEAKCILNSQLMQDPTKGRGHGSSGLLELIKQILEVKLPWTELVEHAIKSVVVVSNENKSWKNINKRLNAHNILSPGFGTEEKISTLLLCIDTSGSMSSESFKKFISIIKNSAYYFSKVIKIDHDYKITNYVELSDEDILMDNIEIFSFRGRGGTSHVDVFDKIEDLYLNSDNELSLILFLTDFESDMEQNWKKYKWTNDIPCKIICTEKHKIPDYIDKDPIYID
ncbi:MAG: VWA domain-containing protein, partial [Ignavibacteriae bacterium]|nr:VWA domain-containing protein [Ignavibacteriota bacterium]